ncbi:MAG: BREX system ATP-binding domain-containing protein [Caulobacteraceae bacterium]
MSLRDRLAAAAAPKDGNVLFKKYGVLENPYPSSSQTADNPHRRLTIDDDIDARVESFVRDHKSQVIVVVGTQGTGKTNVLNYYEREIKSALGSLNGYYVVRYLADPESSFDGTLRRLFQELGFDHLEALGKKLKETYDGGTLEEAIEAARSHEVRIALRRLAASGGDAETVTNLNEWFLGLRLLKAHRETLGVNFRLDTVESKTAALRDLIQVSSQVGLLNGVFLLLDELEKQDGVLSATAVVRYLSAMRAIIDALPHHLFMMVAVTPDALRRYSVALPAFRSRLENRVELSPLTEVDQAKSLAEFYLQEARTKAVQSGQSPVGTQSLVSDQEIEELFTSALERARRAGDEGVRQRQFLHLLHTEAEQRIQKL